jgi:hypothetical protein
MLAFFLLNMARVRRWRDDGQVWRSAAEAAMGSQAHVI